VWPTLLDRDLRRTASVRDRLSHTPEANLRAPYKHMDTARLLAQGVGGWLLYEFCCSRSRLFNERYMAGPIAQVLNAEYGLQVHSEYLHPVLAKTKTGPGRRPEVDFAVVDGAGVLKCVVESKWVGPGGLPAEHIIWDVLRLELVASDTGADAYFLLAGRRRHLEAFFETKAFKGVEYKGKFRRLLKLDHRKNPRMRVDNPPTDRRAAFKAVLTPYGGVSFPTRVSTSLCYAYPSDVPKFQYQAYVWKVFAPTGTPRFKPQDHALYIG
jgi:hypothetical protein